MARGSTAPEAVLEGAEVGGAGHVRNDAVRRGMWMRRRKAKPRRGRENQPLLHCHSPSPGARGRPGGTGLEGRCER